MSVTRPRLVEDVKRDVLTYLEEAAARDFHGDVRSFTSTAIAAQTGDSQKAVEKALGELLEDDLIDQHGVYVDVYLPKTAPGEAVTVRLATQKVIAFSPFLASFLGITAILAITLLPGVSSLAIWGPVRAGMLFAALGVLLGSGAWRLLTVAQSRSILGRETTAAVARWLGWFAGTFVLGIGAYAIVGSSVGFATGEPAILTFLAIAATVASGVVRFKKAE